ncbi:hypothetical protein KM043_014135 [Ampulex compressa]|nr:hypothetical protein KM043_014135 [Ampulex compressa]
MSMLVKSFGCLTFFILFASAFGKGKNEHQPVVEYYYLNSTQYLFFSQRVTWEEARVLCANYNARLAILDTMEKAFDVAETIAHSNIEMEDIWLGGRRIDHTWVWIHGDVNSEKNTEIPSEPNLEEYPPWSRDPTRPTKECLAIDRRAHSHPNFIDLDCRLQRPFVCEKSPEEGVKKPVPSKWVRIRRNTYILYHARVTWHEAATYCRLMGARLAVLKNLNVIEILASGMTTTRPDFETVWIGAHFSYGQWIWLPTGTTLSSIIDEGGYSISPFRRSGRQENCLLLDRHIDNTAGFVATACDRKRDFVCEEYPEDEDDDWLNEPLRFSYNNSIYVIYPAEKTWEESNSFCRERGSVLAYVNDINATNLIVEAMGDHPKEISHLWIGGVYARTNEWQWMPSGRRIAPKKDPTGFPPWANINEKLDYYAGSSKCLNLDRSDHVKAHLYGLDCNSKQPFVCWITCEIPPSVKNGSWTCNDAGDGKDCWLACDEGFITMGIRNISCRFQSGWTTAQNWLDVPLCLEQKDYAVRMVRSVNSNLRNSVGYYFILDHPNEDMRSLSLRFVERMLTIFPISYNLKMGLACTVTNPPFLLWFNQTDNCEALGVIQELSNKLRSTGEEFRIKPEILYRNLWAYRERKIVVFLITDDKRSLYYANVISEMKITGKKVIVIGMKDDWKLLYPHASTDVNYRRNLYLFDVPEFRKIVDELANLKRKTIICQPRTENITNTINIGEEVSQYFDLLKTEDPDLRNLSDKEHETTSFPLTTASTVMKPIEDTPSLPKVYQTQNEESKTSEHEKTFTTTTSLPSLTDIEK